MQRPILDLARVSGYDPFIGADDPLAINLAAARALVAANSPQRTLTRLSAGGLQQILQAHKDQADQDAADRLSTVAHGAAAPKVPLPVDTIVIAPAGVLAGATVVVTVTPLSRVRPFRLVFSAADAPNFVIGPLQVGRLNLLGAPGQIPAEAFLPGAMDSNIESPAVDAATPILFSVTNTSGAAARLRGALWCFDLSVRV